MMLQGKRKEKEGNAKAYIKARNPIRKESVICEVLSERTSLVLTQNPKRQNC